MADATPDLLDAAPAGFLSFRDDGRIVVVNRTLLELLGYARVELIGRHVEEAMGVAGKIFFQTHLFPLVRMHGRAEEIYLELRSKAGERVAVLLNARRAELDGGPVTHCVVIRVQERKKYEDELLRAKKAAETSHAEARAANEAKSRYLRSVSHDIRTPINALLGYADLLELGAGRTLGDVELGYVARMRNAARHLHRLVDDILDLARIEAGAMTVTMAPADVTAAADAARALVEPLADEREVRLVCAEPGAPDGDGGAGGGDRYVGDHERVVQILVNLLTNAMKFTDAGGRVSLGWERVEVAADVAPGEREPGEGEPEEDAADGAEPGTWLRVDVADTGVGIAPDELADIFEPFHQAGDPDRAAPKGAGLGLAISRELARLMDGDITVRSEPGAGSTFSLWLRAG